MVKMMRVSPWMINLLKLSIVSSGTVVGWVIHLSTSLKGYGKDYESNACGNVILLLLYIVFFTLVCFLWSCYEGEWIAYGIPINIRVLDWAIRWYVSSFHINLNVLCIKGNLLYCYWQDITFHFRCMGRSMYHVLSLMDDKVML